VIRTIAYLLNINADDLLERTLVIPDVERLVNMFADNIPEQTG